MRGVKRYKFGLLGTITYDVITAESGAVYEGLGGILYQAATLCALGQEVRLYANLGQELAPAVERAIQRWKSLRTSGIHKVAGPGNKVFLHYPLRGERVEILNSLVPPLNPENVLRDLSELDMLIMVINSGYDIELEDWRKIVRRAECPLWFDVHSLALSRVLKTPRMYVPLGMWREWMEGVSYLQANLKEVASMLGNPQQDPTEEMLRNFLRSAFTLDVRAVFVTLGKEGVLVSTPSEIKRIAPRRVGRVVDTTGCGDAFGAATARELAGGSNPFLAAAFGTELASEAVGVTGIEETFSLVSRWRVKGDERKENT